MTDLERAYNELTAKAGRYAMLYAYYDGKQPLRYSTERLKQTFKDLHVTFRQNWCGVVVGAVLERLTLKGWDVKNEAHNKLLDSVWESQQLVKDAHDTHTAMLVTGEGYVIASEDADTGEIEVYWNHPANCHMFYDPMRPKMKRFAAKWWVGDENEKRYLNLYYPDRIEHYVSKGKSTAVRSAAAFEALGKPEANAWGEIPMFHFQRDRRSDTSELDDIIPIQDAINKLFADMMVAAEFAAFRQRVAITDADTSNLKNVPNEIWELPAGSSVAEFGATELRNYLEAMDKLAGAAMVISRTPKHYLFGQGGQISGEALLTEEAPLVKKTSQYQERVSPTWRDVGRFILKLQGIEVNRADITSVWEPIETVQPFMQSQVRETSVRSGLPLLTVLRREGWSQDEIEQMVKDRQEEEAARQQTLAAAMVEAQRRLDRGGADPERDG